MLPMSTSSSTTNRRAFPISSLQLQVRRVQIASIFRIAAHGFNMLLRNFPLERTKSAQTEPMFLRHCADLFDACPGQMFAQGVIFKTPFQSQSDGLCHASIGLAWREPKIKMEINGSWYINHSTV